MAAADPSPTLDAAAHASRERYERCIVCGGDRLSPVSRFASVHLVHCMDCGLRFAGRRPSDAELDAHYRGYGTRWFDSDLTRQRYAELLDSFEPYRHTNRILDMGCGAGYFLEEAAKRGWDVYGSEFGDLPLQLSREKGLNVVPAPVTRDTFPAAHFDVVTAFEVVEHLRDPLAEAEVIASLVRPGGLFYCTTPNFNSVSRHLLGPRWTVVSYPEHLVYFTRPTLRSWLSAAGFSPIKVLTTGISPSAVTAAVPLMPSASPPTTATTPSRNLDQRIRGAVEQGVLGQVKSLVNGALNITGTGDNLKGWFVRGNGNVTGHVSES